MIMNVKSLFFGLCLVLAITAVPYAHEGETHGASTEGTVKTIQNDTLVVTTDAGEVTATLTSRTKFMNEHDQPIERSQVEPGAHVMVAGSKLPGGGMAATEVMVHDDNDHDDTPHHDAGH